MAIALLLGNIELSRIEKIDNNVKPAPPAKQSPKVEKKRSLSQQFLLLGIALSLFGWAIHRIGFNPFALISQPIQTADSQRYASVADAMYEGNRTTQETLANQVIADIESGVSSDVFSTGSDRYNSEWKVAFYQMAALGLTQMAIQHPELKAKYQAPIETCLEQLLTPETLAFGKSAWGQDAIADLDSNNGHAYIGYTNLALSFARKIYPDLRFNSVNEKITESLARRLDHSPYGIIETYPSESYAPDLSAVIGSIAVFDQVTGANHQVVLDKTLKQFQKNFIDQESGMVFQAFSAKTGQVQDEPRASGTTLSVYFLSFATPKLAETLHQTIATHQQKTMMGLTGIREYPPNQDGEGDVDSGPLIFGASPSATVFALSGAKLYGHRPLFTNLYRSLDTFGSFSDNPNSIASKIGGPLGKAILLAMTTSNH